MSGRGGANWIASLVPDRAVQRGSGGRKPAGITGGRKVGHPGFIFHLCRPEANPPNSNRARCSARYVYWGKITSCDFSCDTMFM